MKKKDSSTVDIIFERDVISNLSTLVFFKCGRKKYKYIYFLVMVSQLKCDFNIKS